MYRRAIRSLFVATTALLLLATSACDKPEDKKTAEKKTEEVKAPEPPVEPAVEPPPVEPPVEPPPVEPPADTGAVAADTAPAADTGEPPADGGEKADGGEDKPPAEKPPAEKAEPAAVKIDGKPIFEAKCKSCHGADGKGDTTIGKKVNIPSLAGTALSKAKVISTTEAGVPDTKMKGFKDKLSADEIEAVATYVKKL
jgi:mono/diheme cytochrome c family protein